MGRFSLMLQNKSPSLSSGGVVPKAGSRFKLLNRDAVATYDKALYAQIMGATPKVVAPVVKPAKAETLTGFNTGQSWRADASKSVVSSVTPKAIPTMADVRKADATLTPFKGPVFKKAAPIVETPAQKLTGFNTGQSYRANPQDLKAGEVRTLKDVGKASADAFKLWDAQGTKGVNGIIYWMNDVLQKTNAPVLFGQDKSEDNKKYAALQMDLASDQERTIMEKAKAQGTWYETVVTAVNGGLSLLQSLAMGSAIQGGQVAGQFLADRLKQGGAIAVGQLAKQYGYKAAVTAVKNAFDQAAGRVGITAAASVMPAWISSAIEGGSIYRELTDKGLNPVQASSAALMSIAGTAFSESIELDGMYQTWSKNVGSELAARFMNALGQATAETTQELGQNLWQNFCRAAVDDEQQLGSIEETIDTIIGIFPSSFLFGAGTFNAAAFRQQNAEEVRVATSAIKEAFGVDDVTAGKMLDTAITEFGPAIRDSFLYGIDTKKVKLADALEFVQSSDPYVQWLTAEITKPVAAGKQTTAEQTSQAVNPPSSIGLRQYVARQQSPTTEQQATGRHKWQRLYEQQQAANRQPLVPEVGVKPEFQKPGVNLEAPVQRPTGPITEVSTPARAPVAKSGGSAAISTPQVSVSTPTAATAPQIAPAEVTPAESTLFTAPTEPTQEERLIEKAKQKSAVQKSKAEQAMEEAGAEAEAQQQSAEDMDLWRKTPDELSNLETIRQMQAQFDSSDEGQKSATLRQQITAIQSGTFTDQAKADLQEKKAELRRLHAAWDDAHGWLAQVNRAVDLGLYENAIATGDMTQEQVDGIMAIRQQMQQNQDLQDTADAQLDETKRLRAAIERQQEGTKPAFELTDEAPEQRGTDVWVGQRAPTKRELLMYVIRHHPMNKTAFDDYYGNITPGEKRNRSEGLQAKAQIIKGRPLLGQLMPNNVERGVKRVGMDELVSILESEAWLTFPASMDGETNDARLAQILYDAAGDGQKNATVDYLDQPLNTPAARAARARQETPAETNPDEFARVVNERELGYTLEEISIKEDISDFVALEEMLEEKDLQDGYYSVDDVLIRVKDNDYQVLKQYDVNWNYDIPFGQPGAYTITQHITPPQDILYHGTERQELTLDSLRPGKESGHWGWNRLNAIYMTTNKKDAGMWGSHLVSARLDAKAKIVRIGEVSKIAKAHPEMTETEALIAEGVDGVTRLDERGEISEIAVLNKSVLHELAEQPQVRDEQTTEYTPEEQSVANRTGKQVGAVGTGETVVSRFVRSIAEKGDTILDFGAGAKAVQAQLLSHDGFNVTAYDFGQNAGPLHDAQALARRYDIVMAGNVLNVQSSQDMLGRTLDQIAASVDADGVLVANLPMEPRKFSGLTADLVEQELSQRFENVRREGPRNAPVFVATNPIQAQVREDNLFTAKKDTWEWGAEPAAAIPGEPISFYGAKNGDFDTAKAVIIYDEDTKTGAPLGYKVQLANGKTLSNPKSKAIGGSPYFDTYDEAQSYADQNLSSTAPRPAFSKPALQQAESAKGGLKKAVEATRELTSRQATEEQEALDPNSLFGGMTTGTEDLFAKKVEEPNPEANRPIVPDEDLFATAAKEAKERAKVIIPLAREAVKTAADSATSIGFPNGARIVGVGISKQFLYQGSLGLTGQHIKSAADLAVIGQIFRNPFFETMRYVWAKDGEVLYNEGRTSYMLGESEIFLKDSQADIDDMIARARKAGANELWLIHNHPNGWAMPSRADFTATHRIEDALCPSARVTLKGHVIVDTNQYGVIHTEPGNTGAFSDDPAGQSPAMFGAQGNVYHGDVYGMQTDNRYKQPFLKSPLIGQFVRNADTLADFAGAVKANDAFVTLVYTDGTGRSRLVQEVPFDWFVDNLDTVKTFIQKQGKAYGISKCFAVYSADYVRMNHSDLFSDRVAALMREDVLADGVTYDAGVKMTEKVVSIAAKVQAPGFHKLGVTSQGVYKVQENTLTGYTFDDPRAATTPQNLRFVDALFTDFDDIVASFNGLPAGEYQKAVEGWWQHQVWEQLKAAKIPADVFKPAEVVNKYRMSKGPKSTYNNMEWIKNKLEAWVRDQATTELENAKTKNLEPHAAVAVEQAARAAGVVQKPSTMLAPQPSKKTVSFMDPFWNAVEAKGGYVQHPESAGTDASTKDLLNIVNTYEGAAQQTTAYRKATRGMLNDSVTTTSHDLAEALGGGQALAKPFELPVITSKTNKMTSRESERSKLRNLAQGMEALEYVFRRLDKGEHHGKFWRTFYEPINNAKDYELRMEDRIQGQLNAKISELGLDVKKMISEERTIASDVRTEGVKLTVDDMMAVYLHAKNMDNLRHILSPTGNRFTKQEVLNVIDALTPQEIQLADWMQATRQLDGILAAQVTWDTKLKNMLREQNYWMIERETRDVAVQNVDDELMEKIEAGKGLTPTQVEAGFTKERTHAAGNPIKLAALESFIAGESRVQHYIATMPVIDYLTRVTGNSEFAMSYIGKEGKSGWLMLHKWLQDVANPDLGTGARNQSERFMRWMRSNAASALLGFRVAQFFKAGLSWWVGAAEEGDMNAVRGVLSFVANREATYALVRTYAPQVYHRSMEREIAEAKIAQAIDARLAAKMTLREASMIFTVAGDRLSVMGLWKGKFDSYLRAHPDADPQVAADAASEVVRLTQAAWDVKDQPEIQRSGEAMKLLTMFTNEVTRHYSYLRDSMMQYHEKKLPFGQLLRRLIEVLLVQGLIMGSINRKAPPKDLGEATNDVVQQTLEVMLPVVGRYITNGMEGFVDSSPAGVKLLQELARGAANVTKIPDKGILPTVGSVATILGYFYGLPVEGVKDVYKFLTPDQVKKAGAGTLPEGF